SSDETSGDTSRKSSARRYSRRSSRAASASRKARRTKSRSSPLRRTRQGRCSITSSPRRSLDVSKQRGLPNNRRMRHDYHFVDHLATGPSASIGKMIPIEMLVPNPDQPRKVFGNIGDLVSSIKEKGVLEPVLVRPTGEKFQIIAGERRYRASIEA